MNTFEFCWFRTHTLKGTIVLDSQNCFFLRYVSPFTDKYLEACSSPLNYWKLFPLIICTFYTVISAYNFLTFPHWRKNQTPFFFVHFKSFHQLCFFKYNIIHSFFLDKPCPQGLRLLPPFSLFIQTTFFPEVQGSKLNAGRLDQNGRIIFHIPKSASLKLDKFFLGTSETSEYFLSCSDLSPAYWRT